MEVLLTRLFEVYMDNNFNLEASVISDDIKVKKGRFAYNISAFGLFLFGIISTFFQIIMQLNIF